MISLAALNAETEAITTTITKQNNVTEAGSTNPSSPEVDHTVSEAEIAGPKADHVVPVGSITNPRITDADSSNPIIPEVDHAASEAKAAGPKADHVAPAGPITDPRITEAGSTNPTSPEVDHAASEAKAAGPKADHVAPVGPITNPRITEAGSTNPTSPEVDHAASEAKAAGPTADHVVPVGSITNPRITDADSSNPIIPEVVHAASEAKAAGPKADYNVVPAGPITDPYISLADPGCHSDKKSRPSTGSMGIKAPREWLMAESVRILTTFLLGFVLVVVTSLVLLWYNGCTQEDFRCKDGTCITWDRVCDGIKDCSTGEDDHKKLCPDKKTTASKLPMPKFIDCCSLKEVPFMGNIKSCKKKNDSNLSQLFHLSQLNYSKSNWSPKGRVIDKIGKSPDVDENYITKDYETRYEMKMLKNDKAEDSKRKRETEKISSMLEKEEMVMNATSNGPKITDDILRITDNFPKDNRSFSLDGTFPTILKLLKDDEVRKKVGSRKVRSGKKQDYNDKKPEVYYSLFDIGMSTYIVPIHSMHFQKPTLKNNEYLSYSTTKERSPVTKALKVFHSFPIASVNASSLFWTSKGPTTLPLILSHKLLKRKTRNTENKEIVALTKDTHLSRTSDAKEKNVANSKENVIPIKQLYQQIEKNFSHLENGSSDTYINISLDSSMSLPTSTLTTFTDDFASPKKCICEHRTVKCFKLKTIPTNISPEVTKLVLADNKISSINPRDLIHYPNLKDSLLLQNNLITSLPSNVFKAQTKLEELFLYRNQIKQIKAESCTGLHQLRTLHLHKNQLENIELSCFLHTPLLTTLLLSNNGLSLTGEVFPELRHLTLLYLQKNKISYITEHLFANLTNLRTLSLHQNHITGIHLYAFKFLGRLESLDLSYNPIKRVAHIFRFLDNLRSVNLRGLHLTTESYEDYENLTSLTRAYFPKARFCLYLKNVDFCQPTSDGITTREDLMRSRLLRVCVWLVALVTGIGNGVVLLCRHISAGDDRMVVFSVKNLALADLLMGVYLIIVGIQDHVTRGLFFRAAPSWTSSLGCTIAGCLAFVSCEASVFMLAFMSLQRYLTITRPLGSSHLSMSFVRQSIAIIWVTSFALALFPVTGMTSFYGMNTMCFPLHIDEPFLEGWQFSAFVFLGLNSFSMMVIVGSYGSMFQNIRTTRSKTPLSKTDMSFALRILFIVLTDCICWLPILVFKVIALSGIAIPGEAYAWLVVLVLPINSAINPILYTFSTPHFVTNIRKTLMKIWPARKTRKSSDTETCRLSSSRCYNGVINMKGAQNYNYIQTGRTSLRKKSLPFVDENATDKVNDEPPVNPDSSLEVLSNFASKPSSNPKDSLIAGFGNTCLKDNTADLCPQICCKASETFILRCQLKPSAIHTASVVIKNISSNETVQSPMLQEEWRFSNEDDDHITISKSTTYNYFKIKKDSSDSTETTSTRLPSNASNDQSFDSCATPLTSCFVEDYQSSKRY